MNEMMGSNDFSKGGFSTTGKPVYIELLNLQNETALFTGDQGEQQLYTYTIPANFFTQNGSIIEAKIRAKYIAGANGFTGVLTVKLDGNTIFNADFVPFAATNITSYIGQLVTLGEMVKLNGSTSVLNTGGLGFITYDNTVSHTITVSYADAGNDATNTFQGAFFRVTGIK